MPLLTPPRWGALALAAALVVASAIGPPPSGETGSRSIQVGADGALADAAPPRRDADGTGVSPSPSSRAMRREPVGPGASEASALEKLGAQRFSESAELRPADDLEGHGRTQQLPVTNATQAQSGDEARWGWWQPYQGGLKGDLWKHLCPRGTFLTEFRVQTLKDEVIGVVGPASCSDGGHRLPQHGTHKEGIGSPWSKQQGWLNYRVRSDHRVDFLCLESDCAGGGGNHGRVDRTYVCPGGAKIAGVGGRMGKVLSGIQFFCGCEKGKKVSDDGKGCVTTAKCKWENWEPWSECSAKCGGGVQKRTRDYKQPKGGKSCEGPGSEVRKCNQHPCPQKKATKKNR